MANSKRPSEKESFWRLVLGEHRRSGLAVRAFCRVEGISEPSFYAWRREIKKRDAKPASDVVEPPSLIPVNVVDTIDEVSSDCDKSPSSMLEVVTPSGFALRFHEGIEPQRLDALLGVVARCHMGASPC